MSVMIVDIGWALVGKQFSYCWVNVCHILAKLLSVLQSIGQSTVFCFWKKGNRYSSKQWTAAEDKRRPEGSKCFLKEKRHRSNYSLICHWVLKMWREKSLQLSLRLIQITELTVSSRREFEYTFYIRLSCDTHEQDPFCLWGVQKRLA